MWSQYGQHSLNDVPIALIGSVSVTDQVVVNCRHIVCHIDCKYGHEKLFPDRSISRISVSIGVLPTRRTKNNCSMTYLGKENVFSNELGLGWGEKLTWDDTVRSEGSLNKSLPKRVGWFGYCVRQYSSSAHWDFSCSDSMCATSDSPQASVKINNKKFRNLVFEGNCLCYCFRGNVEKWKDRPKPKRYMYHV